MVLEYKLYTWHGISQCLKDDELGYSLGVFALDFGGSHNNLGVHNKLTLSL